MSAADRRLEHRSALQLFVLRDGDLVASELFGEGIYLLGGAGSDVLLEHADGEMAEPLQLEFLEGQVRLEGSAGFHLNGVRVAEAQLSSADEVWLGPYLLKTRIMGAGTRGMKAKSPRAANSALALVPEPPRPPPPEFDLEEVDELLAAPLTAAHEAARPREPIEIAPPTLVELDDDETAELLTPIMEVLPEVNEWGETDVEVEGELTFAFLEELQEQPLRIEDVEDLSLPEPEVLEAEPEGEEITAESPPLSPAIWNDPNPFASSMALEPAGAASETETTESPRSRNATPGAGESLAVQSDPGVLHARIFWDETLLFSSSSSPRANQFGAPADERALQLYGFGDQHAPLVRTTSTGFQLQLPEGAQALQQSADSAGSWLPAIASQSREMQLPLGAVVRLTRERFVLELSAQPAPQKATGDARESLDLRMLALLVLLGVGVLVFIKLLPKVIPQPVIAPEVMRHIQMSVAKKEAKPLLKKIAPTPAEPTAKPAPLAQVTSLKQVDAPLKSLNKIARATKGLSSLLSSLTAAPGRKSALSALTGLSKGPAPMPSLSGRGASGPVTKGSELLRGGVNSLLASATGGHGEVHGIPVNLPKRPSRVQGSIDRDAVGRIINEKVSEMRACYERALFSDPNLGAGKVQLEWTIGARGEVTEVKTRSSTLRSPEVVGCLLDILRGLQFPKPDGGVVIVSYPVLFNSVGY